MSIPSSWAIRIVMPVNADIWKTRARLKSSTQVTVRGCDVHLIRSVIMCNVALMVSRCYAIRTTKYDSFLVNGREVLRAYRRNVDIEQFRKSLARAWSEGISFFVKLFFRLLGRDGRELVRAVARNPSQWVLLRVFASMQNNTVSR